MILTIENQTAGDLVYLSGTLTVPASSNVTVTLAQLYPISRDPQLYADCINAIANLNDGVNDYQGANAILYLNQIALSLGGAVVGYAGAAAPSFQITIGGKDSLGKSQPARMNQFADLATNFRNSFINLTGNATTVVKGSSGTLHGILINNNATAGTVKLYDNTAGSGLIIATFKIGSVVTAAGPSFIGPLGLEFATGLTVVTTGSAANDVTMLYQ